ncbi:TPA: hypothetical protein ACUL9S_001144, partial [Haemophilus influenzae]
MGYISQTEVVAFGCTSRGQARRLGKWLFYTEQYESEVITSHHLYFSLFPN